MGIRSWSPRLRIPLVLGALIITTVLILRRPPESVSPPASPALKQAPVPSLPAVGPPPSSPKAPLPSDPILRQWILAIRRKDSKTLLACQERILANEDGYRSSLSGISHDDPDSRVRAFCIGVLSRMRTPPSEQFFLERLSDPQEYPRASALKALEALGTAACLGKVEELATSDPSEAVRTAATQTACTLRAR